MPIKDDLKVGKFLAKKAVQVLEQMGAREISMSVSSSPPPNLVAGGCRFGTMLLLRCWIQKL